MRPFCCPLSFHPSRSAQVAVLSVAMPEAGENAQYLDVSLHAHPFIGMEELAEIRGDREPCLARQFPVANQPVDGEFLVPFDIGVLQQGDHVIADRAEYGILEVDDAGIGGTGQVHQVARVVVAVDKHARLGEIDGKDTVKRGFEVLAFVVAKHDAVVP